MPQSNCPICDSGYHWSWTEAFEKFGFCDGGTTMTPYVVAELEDAGYVVEAEQWGIHNVVIFSIKKDGRELMPHENSDVRIGYDDPRGYLPQEIIELLDERLP